MPKKHQPRPRPEGLNTEAEALWIDVLAAFGLEDEPPLAVLRNACIALTRLRDVQAILRRDGLTVRDRFGQLKGHPLVTVERDLAAQFRLDLKTLNLDFRDER